MLNLKVESTITQIDKITRHTVLKPVLLKKRFQKNLEQPFPTAPTTPIVVRNLSS